MCLRLRANEEKILAIGIVANEVVLLTSSATVVKLNKQTSLFEDGNQAQILALNVEPTFTCQSKWDEKSCHHYNEMKTAANKDHHHYYAISGASYYKFYVNEEDNFIKRASMLTEGGTNAQFELQSEAKFEDIGSVAFVVSNEDGSIGLYGPSASGFVQKAELIRNNLNLV